MDCARARRSRRARTMDCNVENLRLGGLIFDAAFDSGNLANVEQRGASDFILTTKCDVANVPNRGTWFYFSVRCDDSSSGGGGIPPWNERILQFEVRNMNAQVALFGQGMRPVMRSLPSRPHWKRMAEYTKVSGTAAGKDFAIHFTHKVSTPACETLYFAFCPPHSYGECLARLAWLDVLFGVPRAEVAFGRAAAAAAQAATALGAADASAKAREAAGLPERPGGENRAAAQLAALEASADLGQRARSWRLHAELADSSAEGTGELLPSRRPAGVYYHRELLTYSAEGRRVDLITISGHNGIVGATEAPLGEPLLPDGGARPKRFPRKRYVLVTARVHPGETPASHVVDGLLAFLLREDDPRAIRLRANFVFKIIPMLNPDGVFEGKFRTDTLGYNLNRMYARATHEQTPTVFAALAVARQLARLHEDFGSLFAYVDCHAHAGKRGCFLYGNLERQEPGSYASEQAPSSAYVDGALFARLVALNTPFLDFDGCVFYEGDSRHGEAGGSGREAVYAATRPEPNALIFTLECNYNSGKRDNLLPPRFEETVDARCLSPPSQRPSVSPKRKKGQPVPYGVHTWRDVGKALCLAAIDFIGVNPASRCGASPDAGCDELRKPLREWLRLHKCSVGTSGAAAAADDSEGEEVDMTDGGGDGGGRGSKSEGKSTSDRNVGARRDEMVAAAAPPAMAPAMASAMAPAMASAMAPVMASSIAPAIVLGTSSTSDLSATELVLVGRRAHAPAGERMRTWSPYVLDVPSERISASAPLPRKHLLGGRGGSVGGGGLTGVAPALCPPSSFHKAITGAPSVSSGYVAVNGFGAAPRAPAVQPTAKDHLKMQMAAAFSGGRRRRTVVPVGLPAVQLTRGAGSYKPPAVAPHAAFAEAPATAAPAAISIPTITSRQPATQTFLSDPRIRALLGNI